MKLIFERSVPGRSSALLPACDVPECPMPEDFARRQALHLPEVAEIDLSRHYTELAGQVFGVNDGFYPLGSCTMKYNPAVNEEIAALPGFTGVHPLQPIHTVQGCLEALVTAEKLSARSPAWTLMTFQPAAGAHGEFTGLLLIKASSQVPGIPAGPGLSSPTPPTAPTPPRRPCAASPWSTCPPARTAAWIWRPCAPPSVPIRRGLMLTNPNTVGLFDKKHSGDYENRPRRGRPELLRRRQPERRHGGGPPGRYGLRCGPPQPPQDLLHPPRRRWPWLRRGGREGHPRPLPAQIPRGGVGGEGYVRGRPQSIGSVKEFYGNFLVVLRAPAIYARPGRDRHAGGQPDGRAEQQLYAGEDCPPTAGSPPTGCNARVRRDPLRAERRPASPPQDVAKAMLDEGMHPPTMYFP